MHVFCRPGLTPGGNLSGLDLSSMMGGIKDSGGQQSRFKWMMEGQSPAPSPPTTTFHKNGRCNRWIEIQFFQFTLREQTPLRLLRIVNVV